LFTHQTGALSHRLHRKHLFFVTWPLYPSSYKAMEKQEVSDSELIRSVLSGNTRLYAALLNRYQHMVFTLAMRMLSHRELAEETTQDIFVKAYRSLGSFRGDSKFSTWLYRIAYRSILDVRARENRKPDRAKRCSESEVCRQGSESTWESLMVAERRRHIIRALDKLSPRDKSVLLFAAVEHQRNSRGHPPE